MSRTNQCENTTRRGNNLPRSTRSWRRLSNRMKYTGPSKQFSRSSRRVVSSKSIPCWGPRKFWMLGRLLIWQRRDIEHLVRVLRNKDSRPQPEVIPTRVIMALQWGAKVEELARASRKLRSREGPIMRSFNNNTCHFSSCKAKAAQAPTKICVSSTGRCKKAKEDLPIIRTWRWIAWWAPSRSTVSLL